MDDTQTRICGDCWTAVAQRRQQQREAQLAAMPTAGVEHLIAFCHGEMQRDHRAYPGFGGVILANAGGDTYVVRDPVPGKVIAQALDALKAQPFVEVTKKSFGREERIDYGWQIWSYTSKYAGGTDSSAYEPNLAPEDTYWMRRDGTVDKFVPRYDGRGKRRFVITEVIPADWYWSPSVVWKVFATVRTYPDSWVGVTGESPELPLHAELPAAWER